MAQMAQMALVEHLESLSHLSQLLPGHAPLLFPLLRVADKQ